VPSGHLLLSFQGEVDIRLGRLLGLLDEAVQQNHVAIAQAENHPRNAVVGERAAHLLKTGAERRAMRAAKRPPKFDDLNVLADSVSIGFGQFENPFANRFASRRSHIEPRGQFFRAVDHPGLLCQNWHNIASFFWLSFATDFCTGKVELFQGPARVSYILNCETTRGLPGDITNGDLKGCYDALSLFLSAIPSRRYFGGTK
jgi:hypothetical protein